MNRQTGIEEIRIPPNKLPRKQGKASDASDNDGISLLFFRGSIHDTGNQDKNEEKIWKNRQVRYKIHERYPYMYLLGREVSTILIIRMSQPLDRMRSLFSV
jgi:hypothetical protein